MKKTLFLLTLATLLSVNLVFADTFDSLTGITPAQKQKLTQIHSQFKMQNDALEQKIISYNNKLIEVQKDTTKSISEIAMLKAAYERNLKTLKAQQAKLEADVDGLYKSVMTMEQYNSYKNQKTQVENSFQHFLNTVPQ